MKTKSNPHAWFFRYVTELENYNKDFEKVIREGIILDYTDGKTDSLSVMYRDYPEQYSKMKSELMHMPPKSPKGDFKKSVQVSDELDKARKRLIACLFGFLKDRNPTIQLVKSVACQSAKVKDFNEISLNKLKSLYRVFGEKNTKGMTATEKELIWAALRKEHQN